MNYVKEMTPGSYTSYNSENFEVKQKIICEKHKNLKKPKVNMLYVGQNKMGDSRFKCVYCFEEELNLQTEEKKCAFSHITDYKQVEVNENEPRIEILLPLDKDNKENCRKQLKEYETNESNQNEEINDYYQKLEREIDQKFDIVKQKAFIYTTSLTEKGEELEKKYNNIIDCSQMRQIVKNNQDRESLNEAMSKFILERLDTNQNNKELSRLSQIFKDSNALYTTEASKLLEEIIIELTKKISFNADVQKQNNISQVDNDIKKAVRYLSANPNNGKVQSQKGLFVNLSGNFIISVHTDRSETLTSSSSQESQAKLLKSLDSKVSYQFIFEIYCNDYQDFNRNGNAIIGIGQEVDQMEHFKRFGSRGNDVCNFTLGDIDLSTLKSERTTVVMNVQLNKNTFKFTDKNRKNKNIMQKRVAFKPENQYSVFVIAQADVRITLVKIEEQYQI